jgi:hypothetical protein
MRLTVGPLAPAVYWRRRALVLGAVLAVVLLIVYSCSGSSGADDGKNRANPRYAGASDDSSTAPVSPAPSVLTPTGPEPSVTPPIYGSVGTPSDGGVAAGNGAPCSDAEISVGAALETEPVRQGAPTRLIVRIKNVSTRTCVRDVGAEMQELYVQQGASKQWSSDLCENRGRTADMVTFPPSHERSYSLTWDGKANAQGCTNQPWLGKGNYQLFARVGTKISDPVTFAVVV